MICRSLGSVVIYFIFVRSIVISIVRSPKLHYPDTIQNISML